MNTDREKKYNTSRKFDLEKNHGLIVNQYEEIKMIMEHPDSTKGFREGYLENLLDYATRNVPYYKKYANYKSIKDFPVIDKEIIRSNRDSFLAPNFVEALDNVTQRTSGSTGQPFSVTWNHKKHCRMIADMKYYGHQSGCESHEVIVCAHAFRKLSDKSIERQKQDNCFNIYYSYFDDASIKQMLDEMESFDPKMIIAYGSVWKEIANYIYEGKAKPCGMNVKAIMSEAEHLEERTRTILENYFQCKVYSRYGDMECGVLAQEDGSGKGHRLNIASYYFEILAMDSDESVEEGEVGRIVITDLFNYAMPIIRYDCGDLGIMRTDSDGKVYLEQLMGRKNDVLYTTDGRVVNQHHIVIFSSLFQDIKRFQFIQEGKKRYTCLLVTDNHSYESQLMEEFKSTFGADGEYEIKYVDTILPMPSGKYQITVCRLNKED